jgi:hypothetical protein
MEESIFENNSAFLKTDDPVLQRILDDGPALLKRDWLPPEDEWFELADLRREHHRLLDERSAALRIAMETNAKFSTEDESRNSELEAAIREGRDEREVELTPKEERKAEREQNIARIEAANRALARFLQEALAGMKARAQEHYARLDAVSATAEQKREEAARLLKEAERTVANVQRKRMWFDRISGRAYGGYISYEQMPVPEPPEPLDLNRVLGYGPPHQESAGQDPDPASVPTTTGYDPDTGTVTVAG